MNRHHLPFCHPGTPFYDLGPALTHRPFRALEQAPPPGWERRVGPEWTHLVPQDVLLVRQGWKIHVSARPDNAERVLDAVLGYCFDRGLQLKVLSAPAVLRRRSAKDADRGGSGKFITIYPSDDEVLGTTLRELGTRLEGEQGPYILSDLRWGSGPLYVRYGAFVSEVVQDGSGRMTHCIRDPEGNLVEDRRTASFRPPAWAPVPACLDEALEARRQGVLTDFPFSVERALYFSNGGGVYRAVHRPTGRTVLLKEARPFAGLDELDRDAVERQRRELWAHERLAGVAVVPELVAHVRGHEHHFLAREFVEGVSLVDLIGQQHPMLRGSAEPGAVEAYTRRMLAIVDEVDRGVAAMHSRGVVFGDLHPGNILVREDDSVRFIDLETATPVEEDAAQVFAAPGFRAPSGHRGVALDRYAVGCLRLAVLLPECTMTLGWSPGALDEVLELLRSRFRLPEGFEAAVRRDLEAPGLSTRGVVGAERPPAERRPQGGGRDDDGPRLADVGPSGWPDVRTRIARWILAHATPERDDRLYPGDVAQFAHPAGGLGLSNGAAGVLLALHESRVEVPEAHVDWLLAAVRRAPALSAGLYDGAAGVAYALECLGATDPARELAAGLAAAVERVQDRSLFSGLAGIGAALTWFAARTGDVSALAGAREAGDRLIAGRPAAQGEDGARSAQLSGLLRGRSGEALFLLGLHDLTGDDVLLTAAEAAVRADVDALARLTASRHRAGPVANGSVAEAGGVALAVQMLLEHGVGQDLVGFCESVAAAGAVSARLTPGLLHGRAGELLVAISLHSSPEAVAAAAAAHLPALGLVEVRDAHGSGFLGDALLRLSCDLGTGAAGLVAVLDRVLGGRAGSPRPLHLFGTGLTTAPDGSSPWAVRTPAGAG
nr:class III lanthionine synthetase LanKC [uncultured Actinotalea sp.]